MQHRLGIDDFDALVLQQKLHGLAHLVAAEMPDLNRQLRLVHALKDRDQNPCAGEVALASGADHDATAGKALLRKRRRIAESLVYRFTEVLH